MTKKFLSIGCLLLFIVPAYSAYANGEKVAVLDFKSILAPSELGVAVAEILRTELVVLGDYMVIERGMLEQVLKEQEFQLTGAVDSETAIEIGRAEWEYAARSGSETMYFFGNDLDKLKDHTWYAQNSNNKTHPVGQRTSNAFGFRVLAEHIGSP